MFLEHCWLRNVIMSEVSSHTHSGSFIASGVLWLEVCMALKPKKIEFLSTLWRRKPGPKGSLLSIILSKCKWHVVLSCKQCCLSHTVRGCCRKKHFHLLLHSCLICEITFKKMDAIGTKFQGQTIQWYLS